ncbi:MAG: glycosyltransferase family 4 protein [Xanthobacteraceae bacterium]
MIPLQRVAFIGNHLPRRCGIATFTHDLHQAVSTAQPDLKTGIVAMTDRGRDYDYPSAVQFEIPEDSIEAYVQAAAYLNKMQYDVVCLQHEYGIFGGEAGGNIIELLSRLDMPIVTTLHTVLPEPAPVQRRVMDRILELSSTIVVMSEKGREFLRTVYDVPARKIEIIPHGLPEFPFLETDHAKAKLGFTGKNVILTFGLLSPSKGIETVINAMPEIIKSSPSAVYVVLGATHPNLVRDKGEAYRESLIARVKELGIEDHVVFFNQFVDQPTLLDFISMCDVYVTPYLNEAQMTSGTLAYSFGLGKAVVSTPYWHARELLADGRGVLVPFGDVKTVGAEIANLLTNDVRREAMRQRAYADSRSMIWEQTAKRYLAVFEAAREPIRLESSPPIDPVLAWSKRPTIPELRTGHFLSLCDSTGMLQHATHSVPDRAHGYCIDDNARALLFSNALMAAGKPKLAEAITARFAAFIQHAWNPDNRRFRNFMSYDRRWLEDAGSEDSHGRTLWALAECARTDADHSRRRWARSLFKDALPIVETFSSPRAWAFTLLGLDAFCTKVSADADANRLRLLLADRLLASLAAAETKDWIWFEDVLAYDNARLSQALIQTGVATESSAYVDSGVRTLRWLMSLQTTSLGHFRPVGTSSYGRRRRPPEMFDQQPVEASAAISACIVAWHADGGAEWPAGAMRAFSWFIGENDLRASLIDPDTGSCLDGLHPDRPNENKGAESALAYLLGLLEISQFKRSSVVGRTEPVSSKIVRRTASSAAAETTPRGLLVAIPIFEPPEPLSEARSDEGRRQTFQAGD